MRTVVGVIDPLTMVRRELEVSLEAEGFDVIDSPPDPASFLRGSSDRALVVSLTGTFGLSDLDRVRRGNLAAPIVVLVDSASVDIFAELLRRGRVYPVRRMSSAAAITRCVTASLEDMCLLPTAIARDLARNGPDLEEYGITAEELSWLRRLAGGDSVQSLASDICLSERSAYRRLGSIYAKLGVRTRTQAITHLARFGLLTSLGQHSSSTVHSSKPSSNRISSE
ncbi:LuxR C-terminal-related transcriptional regulator [Salinibacterium sp. SWN167]|uniref:helix-turn-helix transcriptional regulator n=1 Tax=Salinibacterium sp. SWN167 TaxID=2792054 RepID=UPI0018CF6E63|nr:LuxR C-terminal-related transcriptional regulator [Salinibacterium sp. SWN167]MBH0082386.1 response regulator transcription factor [Salinibacterium sp. SWN167]